MTTTRMPPTTQPALRDLVHQLTDIAAPSGNEDRMVAYLVDRLRERGLSPVVDRIGNVRIVLG